MNRAELVREVSEHGQSTGKPSMGAIVQLFVTVICSFAVGLLIVSTWRLLP